MAGKLARRFYGLLDTLPEAWAVRRMHAEDLSGSQEKLFLFLSGWLGGPHLYAAKYGSMCMTAPHRPYAIGPKERDQWLLCMRLALEECVCDAALRESLYGAFAGLANHMRNRAETPAEQAGQQSL